MGEVIWSLLWKIMPLSMRRSLSHRIQLLQHRAVISLPRSEISLFTGSAETELLFRDKISDHYPFVIYDEEPLPPYTIITTCLNEAKSVVKWLHSVAGQNPLPKEVIIVDGGSTDGTPELVRAWDRAQPTSTKRLSIRLILEPGVNIAQGRNRAISLVTKTSLILLSDLGCELDLQWANYLVRAFSIDPRLDVAMGWYEVKYGTRLAEAVAGLIVPKLAQLDPQIYLPSARSLALRRHVWEQVGGFPEFLTHAGEDSLFDFYLKCSPARFAFVPDAVVQWNFPSSFLGLFRMISRYGRGDAEGGVISWAHYLWLSKHAAFGLLELVLGAMLGVLALSLASAGLGILALIFTLAFIRRTISCLAKYQPTTRDVTLRAKFERSVARVVVALGQLTGFLRGVLARREVERRRILSAPLGHLLVFANQGADSFIELQLRLGWFVTRICEKGKHSTTTSQVHPHYEFYYLDEFDIQAWLGKHLPLINEHKRRFEYCCFGEGSSFDNSIHALDASGAVEYRQTPTLDTASLG